jgi:hypothetical protein
VVNQGQAKANSSKTNVRLSPSPDRPTKDDPLLVSFDTPALDPNQSVTHEAEVTIPAETKAGDYYVWVIVDVDSTAGQSDESNDRIKAPLKVKAALPGTLTVSVKDVQVNLDNGTVSTDKPLAGITVRLIKNGKEIAAKNTDSNGKVTFSVEQGTYVVRASINLETTLLAEKEIAINAGQPVSVTLYLAVNVVQQLYDIKDKLEKLNVTLLGFPLGLKWGYDMSQVTSAISALARDTQDAEKAIETLKRLLLALDYSNKLKDEAGALADQLGKCIVDICALAYETFRMLRKVESIIKILPDNIFKKIINMLIVKIEELVVYAMFKLAEYLSKSTKIMFWGIPIGKILGEIIGHLANMVRIKVLPDSSAWKDIGEEFKKEILSVIGEGAMIKAYIYPTQPTINEVGNLASNKAISDSWSNAYNKVKSRYSAINMDVQNIVKDAENKREAARFAYRSQGIPQKRIASVVGAVGFIVPEPGTIKTALKTLAVTLKGAAVALNVGASIDCGRRLVKLGSDDLPLGVMESFRPDTGKGISKSVDIAKWDGSRHRLIIEIIEGITQKFLSALDQLKLAIKEGNLPAVLQKLEDVMQAESELLRGWERILSVASAGLGESFPEGGEEWFNHPVVKALIKAADTAIEHINLYAAAIDYLLKTSTKGRASRQVQQELINEIEQAKQSVQETEKTIIESLQNLPPVTIPAVLNIVQINMPSVVRFGQSVQVNVVIVNDGGQDATNVRANLSASGGIVDQSEKAIGNLPAGASAQITWTVTPKEGADFIGIVVNANGDEAVSGSANANLRVYRSIDVEVPKGLRMISFNFEPEEKDPAKLLGVPVQQLKIAWWNPTKGAYEYYGESNKDLFQVTTGKAFWVKMESDVHRQIFGFPETSLRIPLVPGWNMVGIAFDKPVLWKLDAITVAGLDGEKTLEEAEEAGWISSYAWAYEPETNSYRLVYDTGVIPNVISELEPGRGYWIWAGQPCVLQFSLGQQRGRITKYKSNGSWSMRLQALVDGSVGEAVLGIANGTRGLAVGLPPEPPTGNNGVQVILLKNNTPLAVDVRSDGSRRQEWEVLVRFGTRDGGRGTSERKEVVLTFDGIGYAPKDVSAWLVDTVTGKRVYLRTQPSYRFAPEVGETERRFKVIVESGNERPLRIVGLKATPMRGEGLVITFALTKPAQVRGEVMTLTGRKIAVMDDGSTRMAGTHRMIWRGVGSEGVKVPVGAYLVRLVATDEDGRQVQAVTVVRGR